MMEMERYEGPHFFNDEFPSLQFKAVHFFQGKAGMFKPLEFNDATTSWFATLIFEQLHKRYFAD
jgi:hypothetical protein